MNETVLTILFVAGVTAFFSYISYRQKKSSWIGELIDKKYIEADTDDDSSTPEKYILIFKTISGKKVKVTVSKETYNAFNLGDKAQKKSGDYYPVKIS